MSRFRLNGWQRIGIVLSVVWAIGAAIYDNFDRHSDTYKAAFDPVYDRCRKFQDQGCFDEAGCVAAAVPKQSQWNLAIVALVPLPFFWLIAYALIGLVRWIRRGFRPT